MNPIDIREPMQDLCRALGLEYTLVKEITIKPLEVEAWTLHFEDGKPRQKRHLIRVTT